MEVKNIQLIDTIYNIEQYKPSAYVEIAVVGRSNAGKSSLVNRVSGRKKIARVSKQPGKTRSVNIYQIDDALMLVDLPGYGFAKRSKKEQDEWADLINGYLEKTKTLAHLLLLCDIRHSPSEQDRQMVEWMQYYDIPFTVIATKADKLGKSRRKPAAEKIGKELGTKNTIAFSATEGIGLDELLSLIQSVVQQKKI